MFERSGLSADEEAGIGTIDDDSLRFHSDILHIFNLKCALDDPEAHVHVLVKKHCDSSRNVHNLYSCPIRHVTSPRSWIRKNVGAGRKTARSTV